MNTSQTPSTIYCHTITRHTGRSGKWMYWCVARYVAKPRADGVLTWRRDYDVTDGYRSPAKAARESDVGVLASHVRQNDRVTL